MIQRTAIEECMTLPRGAEKAIFLPSMSINTMGIIEKSESL